MSAAEDAIRKAEASGVRIWIEGDELVLDAERKPPPEVLADLRNNKPQIIELLASANEETGRVIPFVKSGFERRPDDDYQTIDPRCAAALVDSLYIPGAIWEPCAAKGSALADELERLLGEAIWRSLDALQKPPGVCRAAVTNPPYSLPLCDQIVQHLRDCVADGELDMAAILLRSQWDHARRRSRLLDHPPFAGSIRLRFRPIWSDQRTKQPIHDFQWLIFDRRHQGDPIIRYWPRYDHAESALEL